MSTVTATSPVSGLTDEQRDFVAAIRDFCEREGGTPEKREALTEGYTEPPQLRPLPQKMAELGWLGVTIPEEYGGSGGSYLDACLFMEETSRGMAPIGGYATTLIVAGATKRFGTEEQKKQVLGGIASGSVEAIAMTEPEAGSDVGALSSQGRARRTAATSSTGRRSSSPTPTSPTTSWSSAAHQGREQARGPVDDLRSRPTPRAWR